MVAGRASWFHNPKQCCLSGSSETSELRPQYRKHTSSSSSPPRLMSLQRHILSGILKRPHESEESARSMKEGRGSSLSLSLSQSVRLPFPVIILRVNTHLSARQEGRARARGLNAARYTTSHATHNFVLPCTLLLH